MITSKAKRKRAARRGFASEARDLVLSVVCESRGQERDDMAQVLRAIGSNRPVSWELATRLVGHLVAARARRRMGRLRLCG